LVALGALPRAGGAWFFVQAAMRDGSAAMLHILSLAVSVQEVVRLGGDINTLRKSLTDANCVRRFWPVAFGSLFKHPCALDQRSSRAY
jgi:hypothetical protein